MTSKTKEKENLTKNSEQMSSNTPNDSENNQQVKTSDDVSLKVCPDSTSQIALSKPNQTTRILPFVFVQAPNLKGNSLVTVANSNNLVTVANSNTPLLINTTSNKKSSGTSKATTQHIILQKGPNGGPTQTLVPVSVATSTGTKQTFAYLGALVKNNGKNDSIVLQNQLPGLVKKSDQIILPNLPSLVKTNQKDPIVVSTHLPAGLVPAPNNQKLVLAPMTMPKLAQRLPITCPTNSISHPKIANLILPMSLNQIKSNQSVINFKISNGQIQSDPKGSITVLRDPKDNDVTSTTIEKTDNVTEVIINSSIANNPPKCSKNKQENNKQYELSISEEPKALNYTIKLSDDMKTYKIERNGQEVETIPNDIPISKELLLKQKLKNTPSVIVHPKKTQHEASILKKCNTYERKTYSKVPIIPKSESMTITTEKPSQNFEKKNSGRRKSQYTYLRDFDDDLIVVTSGNAWEEKNSLDKYSKRFESAEITFTKLEKPEKLNENANNQIEMDQIEIEVIKNEFKHPQFDIDDTIDIKNLLHWQNGVGLLDGSNLKFQVNEYGLVELLTGDDLKKFKSEFETDTEILNCRECGCYGMPSEFITRNYCSSLCKSNAINNLEKLKKDVILRENKIKSKKKYQSKPIEKKAEEKPDFTLSDTENSNDVHDKVNYPWSTKKGFSWAKYLEHIKAKSAPLKLFKDPFPYSKNGFRVGMKLEGIDPLHPSNFCVMTVAEVQGYRIRLHFDGYSDSYDFWLNADSMDIFPMGWCEKFNHTLHPPPGYTEADFNWTLYLKHCKATAAPRHLFSNRAGNAICPNGFRLGMKLEAVDRKNSELVCVATINDLMDQRFLVHFDSWDEQYDYWADPTSPYIHPVGWCDKSGHKLTPPNDLADPASFNWEDYLKGNKCTPVPARAFKQRPPSGFKIGMRLECVDRRVPQLIRVATVDDVKEHKIRIRFDGWQDKYSYWVDDDSTDIHPVGWCQKTGHPIEGPLMPEDVYDNFDECPTVGCRGVGHILGARYDTHNTAKDCPYSDENLVDPPVIPDRLGGLRGAPKVVVPISREPKTKITYPNTQKPLPMCTAPKIRKLTETEIKQEWPETIEEDSCDSLKRKTSTRETSPAISDNKYKISEEIHRFKTDFKSVEYSNPSQKAFVQHSKHLAEIIGDSSRDPSLWSVDEVSEFVSSIPSCKEHSKVFVQELIDGEAFLMLTQKDLTDILKFKLGPAIKLYNSILLLRKNCNNLY